MFRLNRPTFDAWQPKQLPLTGAWDPREVGVESDIHDLVYQANEQRIIDRDDVEAESLSYEYIPDDDGGAYQWQVCLTRVDGEGFHRWLRLAGMWHSQGKLGGNDRTGRAALLTILEEGVTEANAILREFTHWPR